MFDSVAESEGQTTTADYDPAVLSRHYFADHEAYKKEFFPEVARQESPPFHRDVENALWAGERYVALKLFRGAAKTSILQLFLSKRIAYGVSRTILVVSNSSENAERYIDWIKKQVTNNGKWATFYGLKASSEKWASNEVEVVHTLLNTTIRLVAVGIHGQIRGINVNSYRPDCIVVDDPDDEQTTATKEQCSKHVNLFVGSVLRTLAPESENPHAMIAVLQTPLANGDIIDYCFASELWKKISVSCFLPDGTSAWPARFSTESLLADKADALALRLLSVWMREMEVTITSGEACPFSIDWLRSYEVLPAKFSEIVVAIDPASSDSKNADDNAIVMWGAAEGNYWNIAEEAKKGQSHIDTSKTLFTNFIPLATRLLGRTPTVVVETIGFQKNLKTQIEVDQRKYGIFFEVKAVSDRRAKYDRILQTYKGHAFAGNIRVNANCPKFLEQFQTYGRSIPHDDVLDAGSMAIDELERTTSVYAATVTGGLTRAFPRLGRSNFNHTRLFLGRAHGH